MSSNESRIDHACDRFERAWREGRRPLIEDYLAESPQPDRPDLLRQLLRLEVELRRESGETPTSEEYRRRFPKDLGLIDSVLVKPAEAKATADYNLLFGIMAVEANIIGRDDLIAALKDWVLDKSKPLGQILSERGALADIEYASLEARVQAHLNQ